MRLERFSVSTVLLDIEGTTSSIDFVTKVMFPFARQHLRDFVSARKNDAAVLQTLDLVRDEAHRAGYRSNEGSDPIGELCAAVDHLMDLDSKTTGLKNLQGMIWENGFLSGQLVAHVYDDVPGCLNSWKRKGIDLRVYSSGSIAAQKLFFGHSIFGDLLPYFSSHYDTVIGGKKDPTSYARIAADCGIEPNSVLFLSDAVAELQAADIAGMQTVLVVREGNADQPTHAFPTIHTFEELRLS